MLLTVSLPTRSSSRTSMKTNSEGILKSSHPDQGSLPKCKHHKRFSEIGVHSSKYLNIQFQFYKVSYDPCPL